jgi:hypothetical protein
MEQTRPEYSTLLKMVEIKDAKGVPSYNPCSGTADVGVGKEVESVLAAFLKDVQHLSKMMTKPY